MSTIRQIPATLQQTADGEPISVTIAAIPYQKFDNPTELAVETACDWCCKPTHLDLIEWQETCTGMVAIVKLFSTCGCYTNPVLNHESKL